MMDDWGEPDMRVRCRTLKRCALIEDHLYLYNKALEPTEMDANGKDMSVLQGLTKVDANESIPLNKFKLGQIFNFKLEQYFDALISEFSTHKLFDV